MPISIIVGGQYGSEGKGKVTNFFAKQYKASAVVRVGGPNSGHTVIDENGNALIFKHLPTSCIIDGVKSVLPSGHYINLSILEKEIEISGIKESDLVIDPYAVIITEEDIEKENRNDLIEKIGSTGCGLGSAIANRIDRNNKTVFAKDIKWLGKYINDANSYLRDSLDQNRRIIIEGTQGFGLSLLHSNLHPYSTSRDTTASGFLSETGLSPLDVDDIIMVIRAFPIRVAGNSGPLKNETTWEEISSQSGSEILFNEFTSVSKKLRRVGTFDEKIVNRAIKYNKPTKIVLNHLDYIDKTCQRQIGLSDRMGKFLHEIEDKINHKIHYVGTDRKTLNSTIQINSTINYNKSTDTIYNYVY